MVSCGTLRKFSWLALFILVNSVQFGKGLAADQNHKQSVEQLPGTDVENANKEDLKATQLQNASHSQAYVAHSSPEGQEKEASGKLLETVANQLLPKIHSRSANTSVTSSSANKTAADSNVSSRDTALNDSTSSNASDSANTVNNSQVQNIIHATLCGTGSTEKETMHIEVEFASTLLENGLYYL